MQHPLASSRPQQDFSSAGTRQHHQQQPTMRHSNTDRRPHKHSHHDDATPLSPDHSLRHPRSSSTSLRAGATNHLNRSQRSRAPTPPLTVASHHTEPPAADSLSPTNDTAVELETDPHRLAQRQRQVDIGRTTVGYIKYCMLIPKAERDLKQRYGKHPVTPNIHPKCSKRAFDGIVRKWRNLLHAYDYVQVDGFVMPDQSYKDDDEEANFHPHRPSTQSQPRAPPTRSLSKHAPVFTPATSKPAATPEPSQDSEPLSNRRSKGPRYSHSHSSLHGSPSTNPANLPHTPAHTYQHTAGSAAPSPNSLLNGSLQYDIDVHDLVSGLLEDGDEEQQPRRSSRSSLKRKSR